MTEATGTISLIAGAGNADYSGDNGPATSATFYEPTGIAVDASGILYSYFYGYSSYLCIKGNIYIADWGNNRIRKVTVSTGIITTYAGTGSGTYSGDNSQATSAALCLPQGVALDSSGKCFS